MYLTEKQNGCLQSGRLREVVAYEKWSQGESLFSRYLVSAKILKRCFSAAGSEQ